MPNDLAETLKDAIPDDDQRKTVLKAINHSEISHGPLPHPEILRAYGSINPDFPERILVMAENQAAHRQSLEKWTVKFDILSSYIGLFFAFIIVMTTLGGGIYLILSGHNVYGLGSIITALIGATSVFIIGRKYAEKKIISSQQNNKKR